MIMKPTPQLRFVERVVPLSEDTGTRVRVLQQWWAIELDGQMTPTGEWRDVPVAEDDYAG